MTDETCDAKRDPHTACEFVSCPRCGADVGQRCMTATGKEAPDDHAIRRQIAPTAADAFTQGRLAGAQEAIEEAIEYGVTPEQIRRTFTVIDGGKS